MPAGDPPLPVPAPSQPDGRWTREDLVLCYRVPEALEMLPWLWPPLSATLVARALRRAGFVAEDGTPLRARDLLRDDAWYEHPEGGGTVGTLVRGRMLRGLQVMPAESAPHWDRVVDGLRRVAHRTGARLGPEELDAPGW